MKPYIRGVGLYNTKAKNLIGLAQQLIERHGGQVPAERAALEALPGVGRKTASIVLNMVFGAARRSRSTRTSSASPTAPDSPPGARRSRSKQALIANTPRQYLKDAHHWLLLHGRYVCTARTPACPTCLIRDLCEYPHKTRRSRRAPRRSAWPPPSAAVRAARRRA